MTLNPSVQNKAHQEIEKIIGNGRLPTIADRENLPYVDAIVKEVIRWSAVIPLGKPR